MPCPAPTEPIPQFYRLDGDTLDFFPHTGQDEALHCGARFILLLAGVQSGKTITGPLWLWNEIERCGAGDYLCVSPSYPLMAKKMLPEFLKLFQTYLGLGEYRASDRIFRYHDGSVQVFFGHASDPDSLESATAKAAWLDEPGQRTFRLGSWEAIQARLAIHRGRCLMTTTPYDLGWLKQQVYDRAIAGDPDYAVINFASTLNPAFPQDEYERAERTLPAWKFRMRYRGVFDRPAGMIYDCFNADLHRCKPFAIPKEWPRFLGMDFGGVNTAAVFLAEEPGTRKLYLYREYYPAGDPRANPQRTAAEHVYHLLLGEPGIPSICFGGSGSEDVTRREYRAGGKVGEKTVPGLPIREPLVVDVETGISRVYGGIKSGQLVIFETCKKTLDELGTYSREVDDQGNPTDKIADKESYHCLDALRYIGQWAWAPPSPFAQLQSAGAGKQVRV